MSPPPISERAVAFTLLVGKGRIDVPEPLLRQIDRLQDGARPTVAVLDDPSLADLDALAPSLAAQQVAVSFPASTSSSNSSARAALSPNEKLSRSAITLLPTSPCGAQRHPMSHFLRRARLRQRITVSVIVEMGIVVLHPRGMIEAERRHAARITRTPGRVASAPRACRGVSPDRFDYARHGLQQRWRVLFQTFDVVICPPAATPAFLHDHTEPPEARKIAVDGKEFPYDHMLVWADPATTCGLPATVVPIAIADGLPIGVQIIGPEYEDRTPLAFARLVEREYGGFAAPPGYA